MNGNNNMECDVFQIKTVEVNGRTLRVGIRPGNPDKTPLLFFNGIGASIELLEPFAAHMQDVEIITFDIPGVGGSPAPWMPYHMSIMSVLADGLLDKLGYGQVDIAGVSWGGALAQEFTRLYRERVRKLVLMATSPGAIMFPSKMAVMSKMLSARRYSDPEYMAQISGEIYGGSFRTDLDLAREHAGHVKRPDVRGYFYQLMAIASWSSLLWLRTMETPTLVFHGDDDPIVPLANAVIMADMLPNSTLHVVNEGHLFIVSHAEETAATVCSFLHS